MGTKRVSQRFLKAFDAANPRRVDSPNAPTTPDPGGCPGGLGRPSRLRRSFRRPRCEYAGTSGQQHRNHSRLRRRDRVLVSVYANGTFEIFVVVASMTTSLTPDSVVSDEDDCRYSLSFYLCSLLFSQLVPLPS